MVSCRRDEAGLEEDGVVCTRPFALLPCQGSRSRRGCRAADGAGKDEVRALPWWLLTSLLVFVRGSVDEHQASHADLDDGCKSTSTSRTASKGCLDDSLVTWLWFVTGIT